MLLGQKKKKKKENDNNDKAQTGKNNLVTM